MGAMQVKSYLRLSITVALVTIGLKTAAWWWTDSVGEHRSVALEADARHLYTDVRISVGVVAGLRASIQLLRTDHEAAQVNH